MDGKNTVALLRAWLADLPSDFDNADIQSTVGSLPLDMKRVVAYRYKESGDCGVVVNSMGTHLADEFYGDVEIVSVFNMNYTAPQPEEGEPTYGPWIRSTHGFNILSLTTGESIAETTVNKNPRFRHLDLPPEQRVANARLIAAAPELLEALEKAATTFREYGELHAAKNTEEGRQKAEANFTLAAEMRAVILKAKGEQT